MRSSSIGSIIVPRACLRKGGDALGNPSLQLLLCQGQGHAQLVQCVPSPHGCQEQAIRPQCPSHLCHGPLLTQECHCTADMTMTKQTAETTLQDCEVQAGVWGCQ